VNEASTHFISVSGFKVRFDFSLSVPIVSLGPFPPANGNWTSPSTSSVSIHFFELFLLLRLLYVRWSLRFVAFGLLFQEIIVTLIKFWNYTPVSCMFLIGSVARKHILPNTWVLLLTHNYLLWHSCPPSPWQILQFPVQCVRNFLACICFVFGLDIQMFVSVSSIVDFCITSIQNF
jgi:hypothetical protein